MVRLAGLQEGFDSFVSNSLICAGDESDRFGRHFWEMECIIGGIVHLSIFRFIYTWQLSEF